VTIRYDKGKISENKIKHSFTVYREDHVTKVTTGEYVRSSNKELLLVIK